jgi:preprotein translocase subunit SecA
MPSTLRPLPAGQKDPLIEFQKEGFRLFEAMMTRIRDTALEYVFHVSLKAITDDKPRATPMMTVKEEAPSLIAPAAPPAPVTNGVLQVPRGNNVPKSPPIAVEKIGRNDPCPCGSGKKYKKCHGL